MFFPQHVDETCVERRKEPRFQAAQEILVSTTSEPVEKITAWTIDLSGKGLRIAAPRTFCPGTLVVVESDNCMLLGEVCYALQNGDGHIMGIKVEHALKNLKDLTRLRQNLELADPAFVRASGSLRSR